MRGATLGKRKKAGVRRGNIKAVSQTAKKRGASPKIKFQSRGSKTRKALEGEEELGERGISSVLRRIIKKDETQTKNIRKIREGGRGKKMLLQNRDGNSDI